MAGIYIHVPFCKSKCKYCDFYSITDIANKPAFIDSLKKELEMRKKYLQDEIIETIYFGGGTPSLLEPAEVHDILEHIHKHYIISKIPELTFEANPNDLNGDYLDALHKSGINRLSIGVQSFHNDDLQFLGRRHSAQEAIDSIISAQKSGFENISIDFIYGHQLCTPEKLLKNIQAAYSFDIKHVSLYHITYEPGTELFEQLQKKEIKKIPEEKSVEQFNFVLQKMSTYEYINYEISNFAQEGFYAKHNTNYWFGVKYIGVGHSAHSYDGISRQWNDPDVNEYIKKANGNEIYYAKEELSAKEKFNEYIMTRLRTMWGINVDEMKGRFQKGLDLTGIWKTIDTYTETGKLVKNEKAITLSDSGKLISDQIISDLFVV